MRKTFTVGRVFGIPVVADLAWLIIAFLVTVAIRARLSGVGSETVQWLAASAGAVLFFGSVLVHEASHSVVAVRRGIRVVRIRLFVFGGLSELEHEARSPWDELAISIAGPLSSLALAAGFYGIHLLTPDTVGGNLLRWLGFINLLLAIFNSLPGFPLDGGRVLRAGVWLVTGSRSSATRAAVTAGRFMAMGVAGLGLILMMRGLGAEGLWLTFIGWFMYIAANAVDRAPMDAAELVGVTLADLMKPIGEEVWASLSVEALLEAGSSRPRPVVGSDGHPVGVVFVDQVLALESSKRTETRVSAVMRSAVTAFSANEVADTVGNLSGTEWAVVVLDDTTGRPVGLLQPDDVTRGLESLSEQQGEDLAGGSENFDSGDGSGGAGMSVDDDDV